MSTPTITVLMSCYNAAEFLSESIDSILKQTFTDFEFLIIDDGSTDDTLGILKHYAAKDNRVALVEKANTGLTDSLCLGVSLARGTWIARIDADDVSMPHRLEKQVSYLKHHPEAVLVGCGCIEIDAEGRALRQHSYPIYHEQLCRRLERNRAFFPHCSSMFHGQVAIKLGGYNRRFLRSQDWDLWLRLSETGLITCLREPLVKLRRHPKGISHYDDGRTQMTMGMAAIVCHFLRLKSAPDPSQGEEALWGRFIEWVGIRLQQEHVFEAQREWAELRQVWLAEEGGCKLGRALILGKILAGSSNGFKIVWTRIFGTKIGAKLADEWGSSTAGEPFPPASCGSSFHEAR
jgi:hypothetical protein